MPGTAFDWMCRRVKDVASFLVYMIIQLVRCSCHQSFVGRCDQLYLQISLRYLHIPGPLKLKFQSPNFTNKSRVWYLGGSSNIYRGRLRDSPVAIKVLRMYKKDKTTTVIRDGVRELMIMDMLRAHPHIIDLLGATWSDGMLCIITPWMENGTIGQFLSRNSPGIGCRDKLVYQIVDAMNFLKKSNIIHGDIKGDNILIDSAGNASIIDFGLSFVSVPRFISSGVSNPGAGTIRWMAPERLYPEEWGKEQPISTFESDIYSLGMVLYEIYSGDIPFEGSTNNMVVIFNGAGMLIPAYAQKSYQFSKTSVIANEDSRFQDK